MTTSIERDDLVKFLKSTGHIPRIERVSGPSAGRVLTRLHSSRRMTHLIGHGTGPSGPPTAKGEELCCKTAGE